MAHALVVTRHGGREVLGAAAEQPTPGEGEVLVEVAASG